MSLRVRLVLLIVALAVLKPLDFYNRPLFGAALLGWTAVLLGVEVRVIKRTNQPYVEPISPVRSEEHTSELQSH